MYLPLDTYSLPEVVFLCECADKNLSRIEKEPRSTFLYFSALFAFAMPWGIWFSDYFLIHPWQNGGAFSISFLLEQLIQLRHKGTDIFELAVD